MLRITSRRWRFGLGFAGVAAVVGCGRTPVFVVASGGANESGLDDSGGSGDDSEGGEIASKVVAVAASDAGYTCAVTDAGRLRCWGRNDHGGAGYGAGVCPRLSQPCPDTCCIGDDEPASAAGFVDVGADVRIDQDLLGHGALLKPAGSGGSTAKG